MKLSIPSLILVAAATLAAACGLAGRSSLTSSAAQSLPQSSEKFNKVILPVGKEPAPLAIADLNHDGHADIIVANTADETLTVLLGDGKGHFTPAPGSPFPCGKAPNDVAVADMNGDANPDLVIANTRTPFITILLGDGKGAFKPSPKSPFDTKSFPHVHGVAVADFNGDHKLDVVTDHWGHDQILMFLGDGAGNLILPGTTFNTGRRPYQRLRSADFNKDGKPDIVTTDLDQNAVSILLGDGKGGLRDAPGSPFPAGVFPWEVAIDDINRDGNLDLVIVPYDRDITDPRQLGITVLLGDGKGGFTKMPGSPFSLAGCKGTDRVATGDLEGNGSRDIVVTCAQNDRIMIFRPAKNGGFQVTPLEVPTGWCDVALADLNGDGKADIIVSNTSNNTITIFFNK